MQIISRQEAYAEAKTKYFTGKACRKGHLAERYTSSGGCVECMADSALNQLAANAARRTHREAISNKDTGCFVMSIPEQWRGAFKMLQDISVRANEEQLYRTYAIIESMHKETYTPFVSPVDPMRNVVNLNSADLRRVIKYENNMVQNKDKLELVRHEAPQPTCLRLYGGLYPCSQVLECLNGERAYVKPYNPMEWIDK